MLLPVLMGVLPAVTGAGLMAHAWRRRAAQKARAAAAKSTPTAEVVVNLPKKQQAAQPAGNTGVVPRLLERPVEVPMGVEAVFQAAVQPRQPATEKGPAAPIFTEELLE